MEIELNIYQGGHLRGQSSQEDRSQEPFHKRLEACLIRACRELQIPIPLWMPHNSKELAAYHQTIFRQEQFLETVYFERCVLRYLA